MNEQSQDKDFLKNFDEDRVIHEVEEEAKALNLSRSELAETIDHTLLSQNTRRDDVEELCEEAIDNGFYSVCVNPCNVELCEFKLGGTEVNIAAVVGFPLGQNTIETKEFEARDVVDNGADELDMVMNVGAFLDGDHEYVKKEISRVVEASQGALVKVILETGYLSNEDIAEACRISEDAGADFVKTSTGFGPQGASVPHVWIMDKATDLKVKAAGGIGDYADAAKMLVAGADRLGASSGVEIMRTFHEFE